MTSPMEYFAESSEAFFTNDFFHSSGNNSPSTIQICSSRCSNLERDSDPAPAEKRDANLQQRRYGPPGRHVPRFHL